MKKLFISQPFRGRTEEDIFKQRAEIQRKVEGITGEQFEVIDQYHMNVPPNAKRFYCLGHSIILMGEADMVAFSVDWRSAPGCLVEHEVARVYELPMIVVR